MPKTYKIPALLAVAVAALWLTQLAACTHDIVYVEPDVDYQDEGGYVLEGEPRLELGYYHEQLYIPMKRGDDCTIVANPQGGYWTSPSIRAGGIAPDVRMWCTLTTVDDEVLSESRERRHLVLSPEGLIEATNFPMFVERFDEDDRVEDLFGTDATLECLLTDDEDREAQLAVECELRPGTG